MAKALIVLTSHAALGNTGAKTGFWLSELTHPYYALVDKGIDVDIVSIAGGETPVDPKSWDEADPLNARFLADPTLVDHLKNSHSLNNIMPSDYQAIVFAGGHGTMWDFPEDEHVKRVAIAIYQQNGILAAICHGPAALVNMTYANGAHLIANMKVTGFTNEEEEAIGLTGVVPFSLEDKLKQANANFISAEAWANNVVIDGRLVTGQNPQSATGVGEAVAELLLE
ncbi:type 1 glutamine amidotransferase domain-containing protein [Photobacterium gaetbulicola]|uniref:ThiJ/PfpI family protein n=1 Tax=Photobacterium gaetbulicola Gung47 TaxID=658445 RepID=A0A0C5WIU3_9GAMM|nr:MULTISPECIES: type 1 glutamine amidotransferase domain-containing protein [Photobacterium]AJR06092.1 ThiJ/PfpI family protein [Photobacterium gaetbulicola Gung47]PSU02718.1 type 1 glutamine amidotransferase domain-containing protein [Photobacterium gaetbulicola]WEM45488.1 type 1 glutamine amidotransferase domain-containing protein [Photobacterium sp. DA100]